MQAVTFIINSPSCQMNRLDFLGHLLLRFLDQGASCFCLAADQSYTDFLDDYLWSDQFALLPHSQSRPTNTLRQVYLGTDLAQAAGCSYVFNCTNQALTTLPSDMTVETIEWVSNIPSEKTMMRTIFKDYQSQKITPHTVRM